MRMQLGTRMYQPIHLCDLSNDELECLPYDLYGDDWLKPDPDEDD